MKFYWSFLIIAAFILNFTDAKAATTCTRPRGLTAYQSVKVSIFYGYIDQRPDRNTLDFVRSQEILNLLTRPCPTGHVLCGFQITSEETLKWNLAKNYKGRTIELLLVSSAVSEDDHWNREAPLQQEISQRNENLFQKELWYSDALMYQGHSRFGYGPDFFPPVLKSSGEVDKLYYQQHSHKSIYQTADYLRSRAVKMPAFGIFSCDSKIHFEKLLQPLRQVDHLLMTKNIVYSSQLQKPMLQFLENIIRNDCLEKNIQL